MTRIFTGDYSTGTFTQWATTLTTTYATTASINYPSTGSYPAQIISLGDCGYAARFECRPGDVLPALTSERTEVQGDDEPSPAGSTRWYAFSVKFDSTWPDQSELGWMEVTQFRDEVAGPISPTISFGWADIEAVRPGYWYLKWNPQTSPGVGLFGGSNIKAIAEIPLDLGYWQDMKMRVQWSADDAVGTVQLWRNGTRQSITEDVGGGTIFTGRTLCPGSTGAAIHQGIYRQASAETSIMYHRDMRVADSEDSL